MKTLTPLARLLDAMTGDDCTILVIPKSPDKEMVAIVNGEFIAGSTDALVSSEVKQHLIRAFDSRMEAINARQTGQMKKD